MKKKRCRYCHELYEPEPRSYGRQKTCVKERCRRIRRWEAVKKWKRKHPQYARSNAAKQQQWREKNAGYWKQWRQEHSGYVARNRRAQMKRDARKRKLLAKGNDLNTNCTDKLRQIRLLRLLAKGNGWQRVTSWQIDDICHYLEHQQLLAKGNDMDIPPIGMRK